nr:triple gene block protein 1 [Cowpea mild mottle virus]
MNELLDILREYNFERLGHRLSEPIVINCVPGAGKTHLIRALLERSESFVAFTTSSPDPQNLSGKRIQHISELKETNKLILLDEYQNLTELPAKVFAIFGDPLQSTNPFLLPANFVCYETRRFGKATASLLQSLNFRVSSNLEDTLIVEDIFSGELEGQVICFESEVANLLRAHSVDFLTPCTCQGKSFEVVTFVTSGEFSEVNRHQHLICLTRHRSKLKILSPEAKYPDNL